MSLLKELNRQLKIYEGKTYREIGFNRELVLDQDGGYYKHIYYVGDLAKKHLTEMNVDAVILDDYRIESLYNVNWLNQKLISIEVLNIWQLDVSGNTRGTHCTDRTYRRINDIPCNWRMRAMDWLFGRMK